MWSNTSSSDAIRAPSIGFPECHSAPSSRHPWENRTALVAAVADAVNSGVALAVNQVVADKHRTFLASNVGTSDLTGKFCQPTTVQWTMDTYALGNTIARAMAARG